MRFCMVTTFYPPFNFGGDGIFVRELSRSLVAQGHEVRVVHCEDAYRIKAGPDVESLPAHYKDEGVEVIRLKSRFGPLSPIVTQQFGHPGLKTRALARFLGGGFDVINFHNISLIGGPSVLSMGNAPVKLFTLHEHWMICAAHVFWKNRTHRCDKRQCLRCSIRSGIPPQLWRYTGRMEREIKQIDALISPSQYTADRHREFYPETPMRVLPLFSRLEDESSAVIGYDRGEPAIFLCVGRMTAYKGVEELVYQFQGLPEYQLLMVGSGELLPRLRAIAEGSNNISFVEHADGHRLTKLYARATALLLPSLAPESFGLSVIEAMACGTPAIVRSAGGCTEIIETTGAGFVYSAPTELPPLLKRLATEPKLRESLSRRATEGYQQYYRRDRYVREYLGLVDDIRAGRDGRPGEIQVDPAIASARKDNAVSR